MRVSVPVLVSLLAGLALAAPASYIQHEKRSVTDARWVKRDRAPGSARVPVRIALSQRNLDQGHDLLMDVADPDSANYGKHWTAQEVAAKFGPARESVDAVSAWLAAAGIGADRHAVSPGAHWIKFDASLDEVEALLQTQYHVFDHVETGAEHVACDEYHVPPSVHPHIDFITPTVGLGNPLRKRELTKRGKSVGALPPINQGANNASSDHGFATPSCTSGITPQCVKAAYGIPAAPTSPQAGNQLGIFEEGDYYDKADLNLFWQKFAPTIPQGTFPVLKSVDGGKAPISQQAAAQEGEESLLDFELAFPIVYPQKVWLYQVDDANEVQTAEGFGNTFLDALDASYCTSGGGDASIDPKYPDSAAGGYNKPEQCGAYKPTNVISVSYGLGETQLPASYITRQCNEFMKLGLQGVSVIYASGDSGVAARSGCLNGGKTFAPNYPASCPYVTSVGATQLAASGSITDTEVAVSDPAQSFYSGGGFSNVFAQPSYQTAAVKTFLTSHKPPYAASVYNASGRGYPDVAALGLNIVNIDGGKQISQGGTSASAPIFASIMNLINDARLAAGKNTTGFLNPTLYKNPTAFTDVSFQQCNSSSSAR